MRVADSAAYRNLLEQLNVLNDRLERASQEVSTGKRLTRPSDSPAESAEMVQLNAQLSQIDQYHANIDNSGFFLNVADSALNQLYDVLSTVYARGSAAGNSFNDEGVRQTLAAEIRALRDQMLSLANTEVRGRYLFAGSQVTSPAFDISGDTVTYLGDEVVNRIRVSDGVEVRQNLPGSTAFGGAFSAVEQLLGAIDSGDADSITAALGQFKPMFDQLGQVRTRLGVELGKLQESNLELQNVQTDIETRKAHVEDANLAEAITRLNQSQTALQAALQSGSLIHQLNLFDYLG